MEAFDQGWLVGILEGEGCFSIRKEGKQPCLEVVMTDLDVLKRVQALIGFGGIVGPFKTRQPHHKPPYRWRSMSKKDLFPFFREILPHMSDRRAEKIREILDHFDAEAPIPGSVIIKH